MPWSPIGVMLSLTLGKTAVKAVNANGIEEGTDYSLNGMKVDNPSKELYIKNGKKVIL